MRTGCRTRRWGWRLKEEGRRREEPERVSFVPGKESPALRSAEYNHFEEQLRGSKRRLCVGMETKRERGGSQISNEGGSSEVFEGLAQSLQSEGGRRENERLIMKRTRGIAEEFCRTGWRADQLPFHPSGSEVETYDLTDLGAKKNRGNSISLSSFPFSSSSFLSSPPKNELQGLTCAKTMITLAAILFTRVASKGRRVSESLQEFNRIRRAPPPPPLLPLRAQSLRSSI